MGTIRLTMAQALVRYLRAQHSRIDGGTQPLFHGVFAIFGHGNVAGLGEALEGVRREWPVYRAHNEQAMGHAAIAFAKASRRRRLMACTTSIGPGATNMVTAAAVAHVNRLPVLLLPGDVFASRRPDPVLQQVEHFGDPGITANDCFRPVSRYWDRINRPEQLLASLPQAIAVLTDPAECGPVTLALPQDVQAEAFDYPVSFFEPAVHEPERTGADPAKLGELVRRLAAASRPIIIAGGGIHYSLASDDLARFAGATGIPVAETQAGKGALSWDHESNVGAAGVTGSAAANRLLEDADLVLAVGTRLQDFTTASGTLVARSDARLVSINVCRHDALKRGALAVRGDAQRTLGEIATALRGYTVSADWRARISSARSEWNKAVDAATQPTEAKKGASPTDAQVLGVVNRFASDESTVVCAAGGLPGELHKLWRAANASAYHLEYGYSCMGYEIAGGLGVKMAAPGREVIVMLGDGSYLMMNSEIATSVALDRKLVIVLLDNRGFGCIHRLQGSVGGEQYNNLWTSSYPSGGVPIDFASHARSMGALAERVENLHELEAALGRARAADRTSVIVIDTDPARGTKEGGAWWDVPVAEVSSSPAVAAAHAEYSRRRKE
jgi:3D-(3,5/4)-trihydroxycyclohexane-1,2-dione acylhydrolase (decyclizing)